MRRPVRLPLCFALVFAARLASATPVPVQVLDQTGAPIPGSEVMRVDTQQAFATGTTADFPNGTYTIVVLPGLDGHAQRPASLLTRTVVVNLPADGLTFTWTTRAVTLDVRRDVAVPSSRLPASAVRILGAPFATADNEGGVPSVWSSQAYAYGRAVPTPTTVTLPVTTGYAAMGGPYADNGYDLAVLPALQPGYTTAYGGLARLAGVNGTPSAHVTDTTSELVFEWKTRPVTLDVRTDAADPATRLAGSQIRIIGAPFATADNEGGVPNVFSSQRYAYGPGVAVPVTLDLPVTTGYPFMSGAYADEGYDLAVVPGLDGAHVGALVREEGAGNGEAPKHVGFATTELVSEWKTRPVLLDVRSDAADPATRLEGSIVRILGAAFAFADNENGVSSVWSSQAYPYGLALPVPLTVTLPVTRGYPAMGGAYASNGYDISVEPAFVAGKTGFSPALSRQEGTDLSTPARHVDLTTTELVSEWKTALVTFDVRTDAADPATRIDGSAVRLTVPGFLPAYVDNNHGIPSVLSADATPIGPALAVPFTLRLPVTTGYPFMAGSAWRYGWDVDVVPGVCGQLQDRTPGGARLWRAEGTDALTPPHPVTPTTTAMVFTWPLTADGVPEGANYPALVLNGTCNLPPTLDDPGARTVAEGQTLAFGLVGHDPNPTNVLRYGGAVSPSPTPAPTVDAATGAFAWTPGFDAAGTFAATFVVSDGTSTATRMTTITVTNTNRAPVVDALDGAPPPDGAFERRLSENTLLSFAITAHDPDGDAVGFTLSPVAPETLPPGVAFAEDGSFSWTPTYDQAGTYAFTLHARDAGGAEATVAVTVVVDDVNRPPAFEAAADLTVPEAQALAFAVVAHDPDTGDVLTYAMASGDARPLPAGLLLGEGGAVTWTPGYDDAGTVAVVFTATDGKGLSAKLPLSLVVTNVNRAPVLVAPAPVAVQAGLPVSMTATVTDPDGDPVTCTLAPLPDGARYDDAARQLAWTVPGDTKTEAVSIAAHCTDGTDGADATFVVNVTGNVFDRAGGGVASCSCGGGDPAAAGMLGALLLLLARRRRKA